MCMVMAALMFMWCKLVGIQLPSNGEDKGTQPTLPGADRVKSFPAKSHSYDRFLSHLETAKWKREAGRHNDVDGLGSPRNGDYKLIMDLVRTLKYGYQTKREVIG